MKKQEDPVDRAMQIAELLMETMDEGIIKSKYFANGGRKRTFERDLSGGRKIYKMLKHEMGDFQLAAKNEIWSKISDKHVEGIAKYIEILVDMALGNYTNEITKRVNGETTTHKQKISDKGCRDSMKLLIEYTELFDSIAENHKDLFKKMTEAMQQIKKVETNGSAAISIVK